MIRWPLQPLLDLRTREEETALGGLGRAEADLCLIEAEAEAARRSLGEAAAGAARVDRSAGLEAMTQAGLAGEERFQHGLRRELARRRASLEEVERSVRRLEAEARRWRKRVREAAVRREAVAGLAAAWQRERAAVAERQAEAALDDRPWRGGPRR